MEKTSTGQAPWQMGEFIREHSLPNAIHLPEMGENNSTAKQIQKYLDQLHIPPNTSECEYSGFSLLGEFTDRAYRRLITNSSDSPFVVVRNLPPNEFEKYQDNFPGRIDYNVKLHLLILTILSAPHETAARVFDSLVRDKARDSEVNRILVPRGRTLSKQEKRRKQADSSWIPKHVPAGRSREWPSVALQTAYSESQEKVKKDMEYWLNKSDDVRMAISVDIKRNNGTIFIKAWKRGTPALPGLGTNPEPEAIQEVKIERGRDGRAPILTGSNELAIPFDRIMLRSPADPREKDFVFTREDLIELAEDVWTEMDRQ